METREGEQRKIPRKKGNFKKLQEREQKEKREKEEEKLRRIKREGEVWEYINRKRGKKQKKSDNIEKEVWREHFMQLLEGTEIRIERR